MRKQSGISLTEILIVVIVIAALMGISLLLLTQRADARKRTVTAERIEALEEMIALLSADADEGWAPTSDPEDLLGPDGKPIAGNSDAENPVNSGNECLVLAIQFHGRTVTAKLPALAFGNLDGDPTLLEIIDAWGNPYVYLDSSSYVEDAEGVRVKMADGRVVVVAPLRDESTGAFLNPDSYQLISAGPDEDFGTGDDVTN